MGGHIEPTTLFASFNPSGGYKSRFFIDFSSSNFSSSDYAELSEHSCSSDYSRIFADIWPLANGWRPKGTAIVFVTQISQMTQIFLRVFCPTDFTDFHRFLWNLW